MMRVQRNSDSSYGWAQLEDSLPTPTTLMEAFTLATMRAQLQVPSGNYRVVMDADGFQDNPDQALFEQNYTVII